MPWIKLHKSIMDSAVWSDEWIVKLWLWCLLKANAVKADFRGTTVERGQFITGRNTASDELSVSPSKWMRGIMRLVDLGCIKYEANSQWTRITVCNYSTYQDKKDVDRTADGQRTDNERTANDTAVDTTNGQPADTILDVKSERLEELSLSHTRTPTPLEQSSPIVRDAVAVWNRYWTETHGSGKPDSDTRIDQMLAHARSRGWTDEQIAESIRCSIGWNAKTWRDPEADHDKLALDRAKNGKRGRDTSQRKNGVTI